MPRAWRLRFGGSYADRLIPSLVEALGPDSEVTVGRLDRIRGSLAARVRASAAAVVVLGPLSGAPTGRLLVDLDGSLLSAIEGTALLERFAAAFVAALGTVRCLGVVPPSDPLADLGSSGDVSLLPLRIRVGRRAGTARLHLPDASLEDHAPVQPTRPADVGAWGAVPVEVAIVRALARLTADELLSLEVGDVVLPDATFPADSPLGRLPRGARIDLVLAAADGRIRLWSIERRLALVRRGPEDNVMSGTSERLKALHAAEVELSVEVGRLVLPLGELLELEPGDVLASFGPSTSRVEIRAGEALVARGELVELEGELGVRITELDGRPPTSS